MIQSKTRRELEQVCAGELVAVRFGSWAVSRLALVSRVSESRRTGLRVLYVYVYSRSSRTWTMRTRRVRLPEFEGRLTQPRRVLKGVDGHEIGHYRPDQPSLLSPQQVAEGLDALDALQADTARS